MGWNSGGIIFEIVASQLEGAFRDTNLHVQANILKNLGEELENQDCDVLDESFGTSKAGDMALLELGYHKWTDRCEWDMHNGVENCRCGWKEK